MDTVLLKWLLAAERTYDYIVSTNRGRMAQQCQRSSTHDRLIPAPVGLRGRSSRCSNPKARTGTLHVLVSRRDRYFVFISVHLDVELLDHVTFRQVTRSIDPPETSRSAFAGI